MNKQAKQLLKEGLNKQAQTNVVDILTHPIVLGGLLGGGAGTGLGYLVDDPANYGAAGLLGGSTLGLLSDPESKTKAKEYIERALTSLEEEAKKRKARRGVRRKATVDTPVGEVGVEVEN